jgi:divalent metal cation (Fe/Co/Zn/Cd) transporter
MAKSFILIEVDEELEEAVRDAIERHPAVSAVYTVADGGDDESVIYDLVVEVEAHTRKDLDDAESEIRTRKEVRSTLTLEVIEKEDAENKSKNKYLQMG